MKCLDILLLIGIPLSAGMLVLSDEIIVTLYGARFHASVPLLQVLSVAVMLMYADGVFVQVLIATERQKRLATTAMVAALLNVGTNFALIPSLGALGAAITTVVTEILVIAMNFGFLPRAVRGSLRFSTMGRAAVASTLMAVVLLLLNGQSLLLLVPVGFAVYLAGIIALRAVSREDWTMLKSAFGGMRVG
jgi:O-antigen/teichoic acid export membrane protein